MRQLIALALVATASPAAASETGGDYPAGEVLAAFATACLGAEDTAVNMASAAAAGWELLESDSATPIGESRKNLRLTPWLH